MELQTFSTYQRYPESGPLKENLDVPLESVRQRLSPEQYSKVYAYVMTSIDNNGDAFQQAGCGPNFQGDVLTVCSCKAEMRTFKDVNRGAWVSGFTGVHGTKKGCGLFYLTKIMDTAASQYDLWKNKLSPRSRNRKAAHLDPYGDTFEPIIEVENVDDPRVYRASNYKKPLEGHVHSRSGEPDRWHLDINYVGKRTKRRQLFLIGDPLATFIWTKHFIFFRGERHPRLRKTMMQEFLEALR